MLQKDKDKRIGSKKGFDEVIEHPFFCDYDIEEVEGFLKGKRLDDTSFNEVQDKCEEYFELICKLFSNRNKRIVRSIRLASRTITRRQRRRPF